MSYKKRYEIWKSYLDRISYPYEEIHFKSLYDTGMKFKTTSCYGIEFYKERYPLFDYTLIHLQNKEYITQKRGSMYDIENVAKKHNISIEEASQLVEQRKSLTNGSLQTYITRYGDELGKTKYEEFKSKCIITEKTLIERHGVELGKQKWENYLSTRDSGSYEYFLKKYDNDVTLATEAHNKFKTLCSETSTNEYFLKKYGAEYVDEMSLKKGYASTLPHFIENYGEEEGTLMYRVLNKKKAITLENMIAKHGYDLGVEKYKNWLITVTSPDSISHTCISKSSISFFEALEKCLDRKLQYGKKSVEFKLYDSINNKIYYYDCYDPSSNYIIEYHGSYYHPSPLLSEYEKSKWSVGGFGNINYEQAVVFDNKKAQFAIDSGYNLLIVWDYDTNGKIKLNNKIKELIGIING